MNTFRQRARNFRFFYGWWIILGSVLAVNLSASFVAYGFPVLFDPIQREMAWSTAALALAFSLRSEVRSVGAPLAGFLVDRFGPRSGMALGVGLMGFGFLWLSRAETPIALVSAFIFIAAGNSLCNPNIGAVAVARWFVRFRSRALALLTVGTGLGGLCALAMAWLVSQYGWRGALVAVTALAWALGFPIIATIRDRPESHGLRPDGEEPSRDTSRADASGLGPTASRLGNTREQGEFSVGMAIRSRAFWHLLGAMTLVGLGTTPIITLLVPALLKEGIPLDTAVFAVAAIPIVSIPGRLTFGWWGDYFDKPKLLAACFVLQALGLLVLASSNSLPVLALFVLVYGSASGGSMPLRTALQADYFGTRSMGAIQGLLQASSVLDAIVAPVFVGITADRLGSYRPAWFVLGLCVSLAGPVLLTMPKAHAPATPQEAPSAS